MRTVNSRSQRWVMTWFYAKKSSFIPIISDNVENVKLLERFFKIYSKRRIEYIFQLERGKKERNLHMQGRFKLKKREYKLRLLDLFEKEGINKIGLFLEPEITECDSVRYCEKNEDRVKGPWRGRVKIFYAGKDIAYIDTKPYNWQIIFIYLLDFIYFKNIGFITYLFSIEGRRGKTTLMKHVTANPDKYNFVA